VGKQEQKENNKTMKNEEVRKKREEKKILNNFPFRFGKHYCAVRTSTKEKRDLEGEK
jgi:hypothetical protein